ncbi:MAG: response regulator transcription factor [Pseudomonadota bacterium]
MGSPARIMVVEDERIVSRDLERELTKFGHDVVATAQRADDALYNVKLHEPDLVVLDIVIDGDIDGVSLARKIREEFDVAIVFLTSHADEETVERASAVRPNGYLVKPFTPDGLRASVETALSNYVRAQTELDLRRVADGDTNDLSLLQVQHVNDFVDKHFDQDISIADMAEAAGISVASFSRKFKQKTGQSPYQFVVERRIEEAKRLLRHTDMTIAEIGLSVGYANQAHFTTAFGKLTGITPAKYRRL